MSQRMFSFYVYVHRDTILSRRQADDCIIVVQLLARLNLEIAVLVRSLKASNVELGQYLDGRLFKCCLSAAACQPEAHKPCLGLEDVELVNGNTWGSLFSSQNSGRHQKKKKTQEIAYK